VYSYYYLIYYSLDQSPLWIDHVSYFKRTKSPFADWSYCNCKRQKKKSAPEYIKEAPKHNKGGYNHPVGEVGPASEETLHTCQSCINKEASASLRHTTHLLICETSFGIAVREEGERVAHIWERIFCISLRDLLALYWLSIIRKFCWVFFP
jgi:hypothetical protein